MAMGAPVGALIAFVVGVHAMSLAWCLCHVALLLPAAAQPFVQRKPFKIAARMAAGAFLGSVFFRCGALLLTPSPAWGEVAVLLTLTWALARALLWLRARFPTNPCASCPLGVYPTCSWNLPRLMRDADPLLAEALAAAPVEVFGSESTHGPKA